MSIQAVAWVLDHSQSRGVTRLVMISLANHANKEAGECWPSVRSIADEAGVGKSTVARHIDRLVAIGEVEVVEPGDARRSARYRLPKVSQSGTQSPTAGRSVRGRAGQNRKEPSTSPNGDTGLFDAFYEFWTGSVYVRGATKVPKSMRGRINAAVKEARDAEITAGEVWARGEQYRKTWQEMERTPQALLANWHRFTPYAEVPECVACGNRGLVALDADGEPTDWDDPFSSVNAPCPECSVGVE